MQTLTCYCATSPVGHCRVTCFSRVSRSCSFIITESRFPYLTYPPRNTVYVICRCLGKRYCAALVRATAEQSYRCPASRCDNRRGVVAAYHHRRNHRTTSSNQVITCCADENGWEPGVVPATAAVAAVAGGGCGPRNKPPAEDSVAEEGSVDRVGCSDSLPSTPGR